MGDIELLEGEEWRPVVGYEGRYEVSNLGRVRSLDRIITEKTGRKRKRKGQILSPTVMRNGYASIYLPVRKMKYVHALVAEAFLGPRPNGYDVMHLNGKRTDNVLSNLRYGTRSENAISTYSYGSRSPIGKLFPDDVQEIRKRLGRGESQSSIARLFGVSQTTVYQIDCGGHFSWLKEGDSFAT